LRSFVPQFYGEEERGVKRGAREGRRKGGGEREGEREGRREREREHGKGRKEEEGVPRQWVRLLA